ncbi:uncharacterized protein LOC105204024 isoform X1 [Solenopsis invicta]|uniref:uncharacterized protein LOC105204024 isoform X1 n=1 Tax=Solenopsis invicta TaxID=13686 RepID=UPI00193EB8B0|nr:uncharacterized protein LOC105204024 isoform X1 [Solenopsis invicta]XP_039306504.1 uncharacterized protein LOC105204024 isoform X1 [Solenopsis invicta]
MTKVRFFLVSHKDPWIFKEVRKIYYVFDIFRSFANLREAQLSIFPGLQGRNFDILWEDEEDMSITITNDDELYIAMTELKRKETMEEDVFYDIYILLSKQDLETWTSFNYRPTIDTMENGSCKNFITSGVREGMGEKWMFKLHLVNTANPCLFDEIRKLNIETNIVFNLANLYTKLETIFPNLQGKNFQVTWKDRRHHKCPGFYITITNIEELALAIEEMYWASTDYCQKFYYLYIRLLN